MVRRFLSAILIATTILAVVTAGSWACSLMHPAVFVGGNPKRLWDIRVAAGELAVDQMTDPSGAVVVVDSRPGATSSVVDIEHDFKICEPVDHDLGIARFGAKSGDIDKSVTFGIAAVRIWFLTAMFAVVALTAFFFARRLRSAR